MFKRYISLYYSSLNFRQSVFLLESLASSAWKNSAKARNAFAESVKETFGDFTVLSFSCGRGATAACLKAAGVGEGTEVLLSSFTCIAVPAAILAAGATPVYTDINAITLNVTPEIILRSITPKTKAVILQHTFGCSSDVQEIIDVIKDRNILLIEDCALALGSKHNGVFLGSSADAAIFSLEQSKTISTGWGGLLIIKNKALAKKAIDDYASGC